ncbi:hypothetical protein [Hydrogenophaga pseudoflava]|uniref:hypothetical protein n=1 Tax=Hydrogenophaga pseudoflava TaxID=47421 RepID=UPI0027E57C7A|nr:hypothetical protein [Hydrogenophaga pseudoflava]MDQ7745905.1 hypothetical protein [Hydrogenophaga pseudoflava]
MNVVLHQGIDCQLAPADAGIKVLGIDFAFAAAGQGFDVLLLFFGGDFEFVEGSAGGCEVSL